MENGESLSACTLDTPVGALTLVMYGDSLCRIAFGNLNETRQDLISRARRMNLPEDVKVDDEACAPAVRQIREYFAGTRRGFNLKLMLKGTDFQKKVWAALARIPYGQTRSYKEIAESAGRPKAVRAVGGANNRNPLPIVIPCHRVIGSDGSLVGYGGGLDCKRKLLQFEEKESSNE
ncbi:methylated-DNA--[protein]-cysteine S-methyltransferase [Sporolactobacillus sp. Y61]|uniref:Methylated-DNA--protein-cysteine methyltransferase n=1 Tax=Sporolactobacillus sp. Y61 TaxID=3160863 RepID=A0AAU8IEW3_9BACL